MERLVLMFILTIGFALGKDITCRSCASDKEGQDLTTCPLAGYNDVKNKTNAVCLTKACVKYVQTIPGKEQQVERRCLRVEEIDDLQRFHGCRTNKRKYLGQDAEEETCVCHNDNCNSATVHISTLLTVTMSVLLAKFC